MKIAFNMVSATHGGGFRTYNQNILNRLFLDKNYINNEFIIFTNDKSHKSDSKNIKLIYISNFFSKALFRLFWMQCILPIYLFIHRVDTLFSPMNIMPLVIKLFKIKTILVVHSNLPWLYPNDMPGNKVRLYIQKFFMNSSVKNANKIIVDSLTAEDELYKIFHKISKKIVTIYLGAECLLEPIQNNNNLNINNIDIIKDKYFLTISSAVPYHCLIELIIAYNKMCEINKSIPKYLIISKNLDNKYFNQVKNEIKKSKFFNKIILIEDIESIYIPLIYQNCNLYIFSSYCEVFGLTNLEAMIYKIPVVTANKSAIPEICGDAAIYFNPLDPNDIKNKILGIYDNNIGKKLIIKKGNKQVKKFNWDKTYHDTLNTIINA